MPLVQSTAELKNLLKILTNSNQTKNKTQSKINLDATLPNPFLSDMNPTAGDLEISCVDPNPFILQNTTDTESVTPSKVDWFRFE